MKKENFNKKLRKINKQIKTSKEIMKKVIINTIESKVDAVMAQNTVIINTLNKFNFDLVKNNEIMDQLSELINMHLKSVEGINKGIVEWNNKFKELVNVLNKINKRLDKI